METNLRRMGVRGWRNKVRQDRQGGQGRQAPRYKDKIVILGLLFGLSYMIYL